MKYIYLYTVTKADGNDLDVFNKNGFVEAENAIVAQDKVKLHVLKEYPERKGYQNHTVAVYLESDLSTIE